MSMKQVLHVKLCSWMVSREQPYSLERSLMFKGLSLGWYGECPCHIANQPGSRNPGTIGFPCKNLADSMVPTMVSFRPGFQLFPPVLHRPQITRPRGKPSNFLIRSTCKVNKGYLYNSHICRYVICASSFPLWVVVSG